MKKRVKIPARNPQALLALMRQVRTKHLADGEASPLKILNWDEINLLIDDMIITEERAQALRREKLMIYQSRSQKVEALGLLARRSRDVLTGLHIHEMKQLGKWGFDVLDNKVSSAAINQPLDSNVG